PDPRRRDEGGTVRLLARRPNFAYLLGHAFAPIRRYARGDAKLLGELFTALARLARHCPSKYPARLEAVKAEAEATFAAIDPKSVESDRRMLETAYEEFKQIAATEAGAWASAAHA